VTNEPTERLVQLRRKHTVLRQESRAWNRRINRTRTKIKWKFDPRAARRQFSYRKSSFKRSEDSLIQTSITEVCWRSLTRRALLL
jgi:hypothetical protein